MMIESYKAVFAVGLLCVGVTGLATVVKSAGREQGRVTNEVRASDYGERWPLTVDRVVLACRVIAGRPMATVRTFDGREFGINGAAKGRGGFPGVEPIWKAQSLGKPTKVVTRLNEDGRRGIFRKLVACEDDAEKTAAQRTADVMKQIEKERALAEQCKATVQRNEKLTTDEMKLISSEGALSSWPPLPQTRVNIGPLIDAALKLCKT